jgi:hypothetical protein
MFVSFLPLHLFFPPALFRSFFYLSEMYEETDAVPAHLLNSGSGGGGGAGGAGDRTSFSFANEDFDDGFGASTRRDLIIAHLSGVHSLTNNMCV